MRLNSYEVIPALRNHGSRVAALLVAGDEPYLSLNLADQARAFCRENGFQERELFEVDGKFDWGNFTSSTQSLSLFSEKKIIELRFNNVPDRKAQTALEEYFTNPQEDLFLLISTPQLKAAQQKAKWVTTIDQAGIVSILYPPRVHEYPGWIFNEAKMRGLKLEKEAVDLLAQNNEGNLFSVIQELDYLTLYYGDQVISAEELRSALTQSSKFIAFDLSDAILEGDILRINRIITAFEEEGEAATLVNYLLQKEISTLGEMLLELSNGKNMQQVLSKVWRNKQPLYQQALSRLNLRTWKNVMKMVVQIDGAIKGQIRENPWNAIRRVAFALSGQRLLSLSAIPVVK
ncbi:DNA polymerase III subunit delta [Ignatzschineria rhizosphaerae]|uniref:DNA polymerase III subunit delta n=1 Tax=Ignatzschineria rhizosphaerae TaxID=2923279 RepID=A0ABY3WYY9_9GAMM|nr:DNA polymerase III subunit delta [Ignatzschineria rhizosphaerae]UNM95831.1 DNA polymerase III subunit delta [Ignatzschineria rhizosphaerae]